MSIASARNDHTQSFSNVFYVAVDKIIWIGDLHGGHMIKSKVKAIEAGRAYFSFASGMA